MMNESSTIMAFQHILRHHNPNWRVEHFDEVDLRERDLTSGPGWYLDRGRDYHAADHGRYSGPYTSKALAQLEGVLLAAAEEGSYALQHLRDVE